MWNWFGYTQNTTDCGDGTFCMNPGNETCCFDHKGTKEITYHNTATIPTVAASWATYYGDAGYSIPSMTSSPSTSTVTISQPTSISQTSSTLPTQPQPLNTAPASTSQQIPPTNTTKLIPSSTITTTMTPHEKAVIGTGGALGALGVLGIICSLYLYRRSRNKRSRKHGPRFRTESDPDEQIELNGHEVGKEMDAKMTRPLDRAHLSGPNELMGQDPREWRAELSA